jgi:hypothetical protein
MNAISAAHDLPARSRLERVTNFANLTKGIRPAFARGHALLRLLPVRRHERAPVDALVIEEAVVCS